jgi:hypothetical protein
MSIGGPGLSPRPTTEAAVEAPVVSGRPPADPLTGELPWRPLTRLSLALALIIGMAEISRLSGSILDNSGLAWSFDELTGPSALTARAGWLAEYRGGADVRRGLLLIYVAFDLAFIWLYWRGLDRYLKHRFTERPRKKRRAWLGVLAAVDLAADILAVGTLTLTDDPEWLRMLVVRLSFD